MTSVEIPWWEPRVGGQEEELVVNALRSNYLNDGSITRKFEAEIAQFLNVEYAIAVTSGTTALYVALKTLDVGPGDEVIVPDLTFIATANAVSMTGATPILADIDPKTLTMCPDSVQKAITRRTKVIVPVHLSGRGGTLLQILEIAKRHNLRVVEDAAQAFGSKFNGRLLGTFGDLATYSFSPNKTITTGQGGAVVTNNPDYMLKARSLKDQGRPSQGTGGDDIHLSVGFNFKLTNLQAAVGLGQMSRLPQRLQNMRRINEIYREELAGLSGLRLYDFDLENGETPQWSDVLVDDRDGLEAYLKERKINTRRFYFPLHKQQAYMQSGDHFANASKASAHSLWIPSWFDLGEADVRRVCQEIRNFFR
jgi:perosamine synthetase